MVFYCYLMNYPDTNYLSELGDLSISRSLRNIQMYILADKYRMLYLRSTAVMKFTDSMIWEYLNRETPSGSLEDLISIASLVYSRIPRQDRAMRFSTCEAAKIHWAKLSVMPELKALISEIPDFGIDMVTEAGKSES